MTPPFRLSHSHPPAAPVPCLLPPSGLSPNDAPSQTKILLLPPFSYASRPHLQPGAATELTTVDPSHQDSHLQMGTTSPRHYDYCSIDLRSTTSTMTREVASYRAMRSCYSADATPPRRPWASLPWPKAQSPKKTQPWSKGSQATMSLHAVAAVAVTAKVMTTTTNAVTLTRNLDSEIHETGTHRWCVSAQASPT